MPEEFTPIESQEALDAVLDKREKAIRGEYADYDAMKKSVEELNAEVNAYKRADMQRAAARAAGLPENWADRIRGETAEDMEQDAKAMKEAMPKSEKRKAPPYNPEQPPDKNDKYARLLAGLNIGK